jgi:hypothetical protein
MDYEDPDNWLADGTAGFDAIDPEPADEYLLNDIGLALRVRSESF